MRVSNSSDIEYHTPEDECVFWNNAMFSNTNSENLVCRETMTGRYLSIQRTMGDMMYMLCLCEVVVSGWSAGGFITVFDIYDYCVALRILHINLIIQNRTVLVGAFLTPLFFLQCRPSLAFTHCMDQSLVEP